MPIARVILTIALTLTSVPVRSALGQSMPADVGVGRVAWFDLTTTNLSRSKAFYGALLDWRFTALQGTDQAVEIVAGGRAIGTIRGAEGAIGQHNGVVYVQVADLQASCRKAVELGATIVPGFPFNLSGGTGAIALIVDPTGHPVGLYSRTPLPPPVPAADGLPLDMLPPPSIPRLGEVPSEMPPA